jgi:hypothetical protein
MLIHLALLPRQKDLIQEPREVQPVLELTPAKMEEVSRIFCFLLLQVLDESLILQSIALRFVESDFHLFEHSYDSIKTFPRRHEEPDQPFDMVANAALFCWNQHEQGISNLGIFSAQIADNFFEFQSRMLAVALLRSATWAGSDCGVTMRALEGELGILTTATYCSCFTCAFSLADGFCVKVGCWLWSCSRLESLSRVVPVMSAVGAARC